MKRQTDAVDSQQTPPAINFLSSTSSIIMVYSERRRSLKLGIARWADAELGTEIPSRLFLSIFNIQMHYTFDNYYYAGTWKSIGIILFIGVFVSQLQ